MRWLVGFVILLHAAIATAQPAFPDRPMRLVVPFAPGGAQDVLGRLFAQRLSVTLGQTVVVENRGGAGGILGAEAVAKAPPDGHTLLLATAGQLTIAKAIGRRLPYDPIADFTPVIWLLDSPAALLVSATRPERDVAALIAAARASSIPLPYASTGVGTNTHLVMEDLKAREKLNLVHVPYRGAAAAFNDLIAGNIQLMFVSVPSVLGFGAQDQLRVLAVTSRARFPALASVPTMEEAGVAGFEASIWTGISAPAGTPAPIVEKLRGAFAEALGTEEVRSRLGALGSVPNGADGAAFGAMLQADLDRWTRVAAPLDIKLE